MVKHLKKISEETIHENPWWSYKHDKYELPNGEEGDYYYGETTGMSVVIPVLEDGRIVLTLQYRYLAEKQSIEFPGGGLSDAKDPHEAAIRELYEESGCRASEIVKIGVFEPANGYVKDKSHVYIAKVQSIEEPRPDKTEEFEVLFRRPDELERMVRNNEIWDGPTLAAWAIARHHLLKEGDQNTLNEPLIAKIEQKL